VVLKLESPSPKDDLCQVWLKLAQWFWRSRKCKSLQTDRRTERQTDKRTERLTPDNRQQPKSRVTVGVDASLLSLKGHKL
jgi:hypothetical protein